MIGKPECFLIDDDVDDREIFRLALQEVDPGIVCSEANDPKAALDLFSQDTALHPEFVFLDINMPKMNGLQLLRSLKLLPHLAGTFFWMYSTTADAEISLRCQESGAAGFLVKPNRMDELVTSLRQILFPLNPTND